MKNLPPCVAPRSAIRGWLPEVVRCLKRWCAGQTFLSAGRGGFPVVPTLAGLESPGNRQARKPALRQVGRALTGMLLLAVPSCSTSKPEGLEIQASAMPEPPPALRLRDASVGLISTSTLPLLRIQWPQSRRQALQDVAGETENILYYAAACFPAAFAAVPYISARAASARAAGLPDETFQRLWQEHGKNLPQLLVHDGLRQTLASAAQARGMTNWFLVTKAYPPGDRKQFERMAYFLAATLAWLPSGTGAIAYLQAQQAEVVVELAVANAGLVGQPGVNKPLSLSFDLEVRVWTPAEPTAIARLALRYRGRAQRFASWMADGGRPFLDELQSAYDACARGVLDWTAVLPQPPHRPFRP